MILQRDRVVTQIILDDNVLPQDIQLIFQAVIELRTLKLQIVTQEID